MSPYRSSLLVATCLLAACAEPPATAPDDTDDNEAESAALVLTGKADAAALVGLYAARSSSHQDGDVTTLELFAPGARPGAPAETAFVRTRCYHVGCSMPLVESNRFDTYVSSGGKTYLRFWSVTIADAPDGTRTATPTIADVYELTRTASRIKLRKSYGSRWVTLATTTPAARCSASAGSWAGDSCTCPGTTPGTFPAVIFVPGGGGCIARPADNESACDDSQGLWMDDDATLAGSFCVCALGEYVAATGACAAI